MPTDFSKLINSPILSSSGRLDTASPKRSSRSRLNNFSLEQLRNCVRDRASQGDYTVAIALLDGLIALCPDSAADYNNRGLMYYHNGQYSEAVKDLSQALKLDPNLDSAYNNRANCYAASGYPIEAIADYDLALDLNPANLCAWIDQGIAWRELGIYDLALENFDITLIIGESLQERIYAERGRTYHLQGDWNCAVADYQTALEILTDKTDKANLRYQVENWLNRLLDPSINGDRQ
jgi:tetratricopeptide (TPR) repeat protein